MNSDPSHEALAAAKRIWDDVTDEVHLSVCPDVLIPEFARIIDAAIAEACEPLRKLLGEAIDAIKVFHGDEGWELYYDGCPQMQRFKAAALTPKEPDHARH